MTVCSDWEASPSLEVEPGLRRFERYKLALGLQIASALIARVERRPARTNPRIRADYKLRGPKARQLKVSSY